MCFFWTMGFSYINCVSGGFGSFFVVVSATGDLMVRCCDCQLFGDCRIIFSTMPSTAFRAGERDFQCSAFVARHARWGNNGPE